MSHERAWAGAPDPRVRPRGCVGRRVRPPCPPRGCAAFSACACAERNGRYLFHINIRNFWVRVRVRGWECDPACAWAVSLHVGVGCATRRVRGPCPLSVCGLVACTRAVLLGLRTRVFSPSVRGLCDPRVFVCGLCSLLYKLAAAPACAWAGGCEPACGWAVLPCACPRRVCPRLVRGLVAVPHCVSVGCVPCGLRNVTPICLWAVSPRVRVRGPYPRVHTLVHRVRAYTCTRDPSHEWTPLREHTPHTRAPCPPAQAATRVPPLCVFAGPAGHPADTRGVLRAASERHRCARGGGARGRGAGRACPGSIPGFRGRRSRPGSPSRARSAPPPPQLAERDPPGSAAPAGLR